MGTGSIFGGAASPFRSSFRVFLQSSAVHPKYLPNLPHLDRWSRQRAAHADRYDRLLGECGLVDAGHVRLPDRGDRSTHIFNQYTLRVERRDALREHLTRVEIGCSVYYPVPLHLQECFRELGYEEGSLPNAEEACRQVISLPVFPELTGVQQERVVAEIAAFYGTSR